MRVKSIKAPSPALVVACIALVMAISGTAYAATIAPANSVRSSSIKDGEVRSRDVLNRNLKGIDIAENSLGRRVLAPGAVGGPQLGEVIESTSTSAAVSDADGVANGGLAGHVGVTAPCPAGTRLLYGGSRWVQNSNVGTLNANVYIQEEYRSGIPANNWTVEGLVDFGASGTIRLQAIAYCLVA